MCVCVYTWSSLHLLPCHISGLDAQLSSSFHSLFPLKLHLMSSLTCFLVSEFFFPRVLSEEKISPYSFFSCNFFQTCFRGEGRAKKASSFREGCRVRSTIRVPSSVTVVGDVIAWAGSTLLAKPPTRWPDCFVHKLQKPFIHNLLLLLLLFVGRVSRLSACSPLLC